MKQLWCILFLMIYACGGSTNTESTTLGGRENENENENERENENGSESESENESEFKVYPRLSSENCVSFLTAFADTIDADIVIMHTSFGDIKVRLFEDTPVHRANFLYLIERDYFVPTQLVRIVPDFVIQGGNSEEVVDQEKRFLIGEYSLPRETSARHLHFRGALAMSRSYENNPDKRSSAYDFYIVDGRKCTQAELFQAAQKNGMNYTDAELERYKKEGGAPHLDNEHTVFGEVIAGMDVVERITQVETDASEWPLEEIEVSMEVIR